MLYKYMYMYPYEESAKVHLNNFGYILLSKQRVYSLVYPVILFSSLLLDSVLLQKFSPDHLECFAMRLNESQRLSGQGVDPGSLCPVVWDGVTCWPFSKPNTTVLLPCMATLNDIPYNTSSKLLKHIKHSCCFF